MTRAQALALIQLFIQGFSLIVAGLRKIAAEIKVDDKTPNT